MILPKVSYKLPVYTETFYSVSFTTTSVPRLFYQNETCNKIADGDGDANQEGSSSHSEPNVESSKNGEDAPNSKASNLQNVNNESD
jgi:hypothetical protein